MQKILVIDDEEEAGRLIKKMLERKGFQADYVLRGKDGLRLVEENNQDVIITDMLMPDCDGLEVVSAIRKRHKNIKIIAMSGGSVYAPHGYLNIASKFGADYVLTKPIDEKILLNTLDECTG